MKLHRFKACIAGSAAALLALGVLPSSAADYPTTVSGYNPIGYWMLNDTTPVPVGDIATNSGSLGYAAHGDYILGVVHPVAGIPGAGGDTAVSFTNVNNELTGFSMLRVPWQSQINTKGPFSVEFWAINAYSGVPACLASSVDRVISPAQGWLIYQGDSSISTGNGWYFRMYNTGGASINATYNFVMDTTLWHHIVAAFDGTNALLYVDGALVASTPFSGTYQPSVSGGIPLTFAGRADGRSGNYGWGGTMAEAAFYGYALTAAQVQAHYQAGTNSTPPLNYVQVVQADGPLGWWRMNEPAYTVPDPSTLPLAANSGTLTTNALGTMYPGVTTAVAGPPCKGMGANNYACDFDGGMGYIDCGADPGLTVSGNCTLTAWVKIRGWSHLYEAVVSAGSTGYSLNKYFTQSYIVTNQMAFFSGTGADCYDSTVVFDGNWHHLAGVYDGVNMYLYIDGNLDSEIAYSGGMGETTADLCIGNTCTNLAGVYWVPAGGSGAGYMRPLFDGQIAHVAVLTNALTADEVLQLFNSAQEPPVITLEPQPPTGALYEGMSVSFSAAAIGGLPLSYQWTTNGVPLSGQTASTLSLPDVTVGSSGQYAVVITNAYGAVTSTAVGLTVQTGPPLIFQQPQPATRYPNGTATFTVVAGGTTPLSYQWTNSSGNIRGATNASYTLTGVTAANADTYGVRVTNPYGATNSAGVTLTVLTFAAPYPAVVMAGSPSVYWRLNATNNGLAQDYAGGYTGTNNGTITLTKGLQAPGFAGLESGNPCCLFNGVNAFVQATPSLVLNPAALTVSAWITVTNFNPSGIYEAIVTKGDSTWRLAQGDTGDDLGFGLDTSVKTYNVIGGPEVNDGAWHYAAAVYTGDAAQLYLDGTLVDSMPATGLVAANAFPIMVGENAEQRGRYWDGNICEVALYNRALSWIDITNLYVTATIGPTVPVLMQQPLSQGVFVGSPVTFEAVILGGGPWTYQWKMNGANIPGATGASYTIPSAYYTDVGSYTVAITNTAGGVLGGPAALTVVPEPLFANLTNGMAAHLKFDGSYADSSGNGNNGTPSGAPGPSLITPGKIGSGAVHYSTDATGGSYNYVSLGYPNGLQLGPGQDFSVAFWTRFTGTPTDLPFLANSASSFGGPGMTLAPTVGTGGWSWYINDGGASSGQGIGAVDPVGGTLNDGQWHSLVFTFSRATVGTVYLDGELVDQTSIAAGQDWDLESGYPWNIGQGGTASVAAEAAFDMDDLGIWGRALTQAEALSIYVVGQNYAKSFDSYGPVALTLSTAGTNIDLSWQAGTLLQSTKAASGYAPVPGASAPFYRTAQTNSAMFFRVQE